MDRILEPELMDDEAQSLAYAGADFSTSNQLFVDGVLGDFPACLIRVVDLGCGPGDVDIRLARAAPVASITAVDGSAPMIDLARRAVHAAGLTSRITTVGGLLPGLPLEAHAYDAVLSKDLLHHLPDPAALWNEVERLGRAGAVVYVMDLIRPASPEAAQHIVDAVAPTADAMVRHDFFNSLCAAFTIDEVGGQLRSAGLDLDVAQVSDRHMLIKGVLGWSKSSR